MELENSRVNQCCQGLCYSSSDSNYENKWTVAEFVVGVSSGVLSLENPLFSLGLVLNIVPLSMKIKAIPPDITGCKRVGRGSAIAALSAVITLATFAFSGVIAQWQKNS